MVEIKRIVKKEVEETIAMELKAFWVVRILRPRANRTHDVMYEEKFDREPSEQEIASVLAEHQKQSQEFAGVFKNYRLVEVSDNPYQEKEYDEMDKFTNMRDS